MNDVKIWARFFLAGSAENPSWSDLLPFALLVSSVHCVNSCKRYVNFGGEGWGDERNISFILHHWKYLQRIFLGGNGI